MLRIFLIETRRTIVLSLQRCAFFANRGRPYFHSTRSPTRPLKRSLINDRNRKISRTQGLTCWS